MEYIYVMQHIRIIKLTVYMQGSMMLGWVATPLKNLEMNSDTILGLLKDSSESLVSGSVSGPEWWQICNKEKN